MALVRTSQGTSSDSKKFRGYRHDVFLSFRGDTRKTFTDHLYTALNNAGFNTFRDDDELERGEDIKPGLQKAIQLSRASVVVFSKDYASSRWCLDELVLILERKRTTSNHVVLPVFYDVDPSDVRKQTGSIGKAFARYEKTQSPKKVKGWREAVAEVADLAGMVLQNQADGYESKFIEKIVKVIGDKLGRTPLSGTKKIQGLVLNMRMHPANSPINTTETVLETNAFEKMRKLQLLHLSHVRLDGCYADLPTGFRWLCWLQFPLDSIPIEFPLGCLIVLEMQYSRLRQVWKGKKFLPSLKILDLSHSHALTEIMDFSLCPSLEELILVDCTNLIDVHESIGNLERLVYLNMKDCKNLRMLPKNVCFLKSLETLILSGCSNLDEFPVEMMKKMESLKVLEIDKIPIRELWPERSSTILSSFPCSLVELNLSRCNLSEDAFPTDLSNLSSIRRLYLDKNPICSLPVFIKGLRRLDSLSFQSCTRLKSLVGLPRIHKNMNVSFCKLLKKVTYQSLWFQEEAFVEDNYNMVEWEYYFKLELIDRVDVEMIKLLGLCNLESMPAIRMNSDLFSCSKVSPVQGLYQFGIFSTFFVGKEVPGRFSYKSTKSSISFSVPLLPSSHRIRGLNIFATYANEEDSDNDDFPIIIKVSNKSKGLKWIYFPLFYGIPGDGEDMIWLSHWKMENETILQCGDQVVVSVMAGPEKLFRIKEFGVELMQEDQNNMMISTQHNTKSDPNYPNVFGGDLSMWEHIPGIYFLGFDDKIVEVKWFNHLIMDVDEGDTEKEGQEDEPDYTVLRTRAASNNCGLRGWKVLFGPPSPRKRSDNSPQAIHEFMFSAFKISKFPDAFNIIKYCIKYIQH
ncbi:unnamed protein product [Malus baccata var. baccata]